MIIAQLTKRDGSFLVGRTGGSFSWEDLRGATVIGGRKGGVPEMTLEYVMKQNGVVPQVDAVVDTSVQFNMMAGAFTGGQGDYVTLFEPTATEVERAGFVVTRSALDSPAAVIQGFDPTVGWVHLAEAAFALNGGGEAVHWVATNTDWTIPQARGIAPGNGTLVSAVHTAVGRLPIVAGKPEVAIFEEAFARFGSRAALMIGDRLDTDILGANRSGIPSALVLTGIDQAKQVLAAAPDERPTYILEDLRGLHLAYPETVSAEFAGGVDTIVGSARVRRTGQVLTIESGSGVDLLRAGAASIWNSGMAIYALDVPAELYS